MPVCAKGVGIRFHSSQQISRLSNRRMWSMSRCETCVAMMDLIMIGDSVEVGGSVVKVGREMAIIKTGIRNPSYACSFVRISVTPHSINGRVGW